MKRFHFTLESVLVVREEKERVARQKMLAALRVCEGLRERVAVSAAGMARCDDELRTLQGRPATAASLTAVRSYEAWLREQHRRLQLDLARAEVQYTGTQQHLAEARRQREGLERYRDRKRAAHNRERLSADQRTLDEIATRLAAFGTPASSLRPTGSS